MVGPVKSERVATYQDVLDAPAHVVAEIVAGALFLSPRPGGPHAGATHRLNDELLPFRRVTGGGGAPGWYFLFEPELHLGSDIVVPDLAAWRFDRKPDETEAFFTTPPDWVCETLSRSTEKLDRLRKLPTYAKAGVSHAWLLDPRTHTLEVHGLVGSHYELVQMFDRGDLIRAVPFEEIELTIASIMGLPAHRGEALVEYGR
jgi:Uma2 family endonuclease